MFGVVHDKSSMWLTLSAIWGALARVLRLCLKDKGHPRKRGFAFDILDTVDSSKRRVFGWVS
jgi:hypothetical protein